MTGETFRLTFTLLQDLRADIKGDGTLNDEDLLQLIQEGRQSEPAH